MVKISRDTPEPSLIRYAADQIRAGQVLGMPTDTFYGLAADPFNLRAVDRVYEIKSRARHKPLSLLIASTDDAEELAQPLPDEFYALARRFWPGPLTIIVDGGTSPREVASTIVDLTDEEARWRIMREGAIPAPEISEFFAQG